MWCCIFYHFYQSVKGARAQNNYKQDHGLNNIVSNRKHDFTGPLGQVLIHRSDSFNHLTDAKENEH